MSRETDPFKMADREIRAWVVKAERFMQGDEESEVDWDVVHHFLQHAADWALWAVRRKKGLAPREPEGHKIASESGAQGPDGDDSVGSAVTRRIGLRGGQGGSGGE